MYKRMTGLGLTVGLSLITSVALADSIRGRGGVTARLGFSAPADSEINGSKVDTDIGFVYGGGLIYGVTDAIAAELDVTSVSFDSESLLAPTFGRSDFSTINVAMGAQYRFLDLITTKQLVPYVGAGLDILLNDSRTGGAVKVDDTVGVHVSAGADYFWRKDVALTTELKGVFAPDADLSDSSGRKIGNFDPNNFTMTLGIRYFFM